MEPSPSKSKVLPDNAFRELGPGEEYKPVVPVGQNPPEVTGRSLVLGLLAVLIFTFAAAYIGLKTGNVIETSIPIAILAVFLGNTLMRAFHPNGERQNLLENVIVQSLGQASGVVVAGAIFTIPALYVNQLEPQFMHIFLSCFVGGSLGVVLLVPLRRYFVRDLHGQLPFPEATAIANVLASGERSKGAAGKVILLAAGLGFVFDLIVEFIKAWNSHLESKVLFGRFGEFLADKRIELKLNATAVYFGLGYIIGPRYAGIIAAGSVLSMLVLVPLAYYFGAGLEAPVTPPASELLIRDMSAGQIFGNYIRPIGIGCIAVAGMIGIIKMGKIILSSLSLAFKAFTGKDDEIEAPVRQDSDIAPRNALLIQVAAVLGMFLLFWWISGSFGTAAIGTGITYALAFLFTPVAARAIAIVGVNPVSGMTLITLILACVALAATGLSGRIGQYVALVIGCAVCTALSTSGAFVSDLKVGYWMGSTPAQQQRWKFLGLLVASLSVGVVIWVMNSAFGFLIEDPATGAMIVNPDIPAPQGNLMAAIVSSIMGGENPPFFLYALGGLVAVLLEMASVPALAFGLGMYLPIEINLAIFAGAGFGALVGKSGKTEEEKAARKEQGTLIASGIMAGAAIMGTIGAFMLLEIGWYNAPINFINLTKLTGEGSAFMTGYFDAFGGQIVSVLGFLGLGAACYLLAKAGARWQRDE